MNLCIASKMIFGILSLLNLIHFQMILILVQDCLAWLIVIWLHLLVTESFPLLNFFLPLINLFLFLDVVFQGLNCFLVLFILLFVFLLFIFMLPIDNFIDKSLILKCLKLFIFLKLLSFSFQFTFQLLNFNSIFLNLWLKFANLFGFASMRCWILYRFMILIF